jgi:hypothetical protein
LLVALRFHTPAILVQGLLQKKYAAAYFGNRQESEVVALPENVSVTETKCCRRAGDDTLTMNCLNNGPDQ